MKFVLSLIASPGEGMLTPALVSDVVTRLALPMEGTVWLGAGEACDVIFEATANEAAEVRVRAREMAAAQQVDANVVEMTSRKKRILIADMDSTIIHQECIDELGIAAGAGEQIMAVTRRAMRGELDFVEALKARVALMKSLPDTAIGDIIQNRISFVPGGRTLVQTMRANGAYCALISGGFTQFTSYVAEVCGFHMNQANRLIIEDGVLTGEVAEPPLGGAAKVEALHRLAEEYQVSPQEVVSVGDGANDIGMIKLAGLGVAMHAKPAVREAAGAIIDHGDLTALLYLQGYRKDEFVRQG